MEKHRLIGGMITKAVAKLLGEYIERLQAELDALAATNEMILANQKKIMATQKAIQRKIDPPERKQKGRQK